MARMEAATQDADAIRASVRMLEADANAARAQAAALLALVTMIERKAKLAACRTQDETARLAFGDIAALAADARLPPTFRVVRQAPSN